MPAFISKEEHQHRINVKHGSKIECISYVGTGSKNSYKCHKGHEWLARGADIVAGWGCKQCTSETWSEQCSKAKGGGFKQMARHLKRAGSTITIVQGQIYTNQNAPYQFWCPTHNVEFTGWLTNLMKGSGCGECTREKWRTAHPAKTHKEYVAELKVKAPGIQVIGSYINHYTKILHRCKVCKTEWLVNSKSMLTNGGCVKCGHIKGGHSFGYKKHKIGKRRVLVQGSEPEALDFLLSVGEKPNDIRVFSDGDVPVIEYEVHGKIHRYFPDILIKSKSLIVEVKSNWWFGIGRKGMYYWNRRKALATLEAGYRIRFILTATLKGTIALPKDWYKMNYTEMMRWYKNEVEA